MADPEAAIETLLEHDRAAGPAATAGLAGECEGVARPADRRVVGDPARVVKAEDGRGADAVGDRPPGRLGLGCGDREALVVADEEARQEGVGRLDRRDPRESELGDEPVLECPPQSLDPTLGLGAAGADPADVELVEGPPDLGEAALAGELLGDRRRSVRVAQEDPVAVRVDGAGGPYPWAIWISILK
jgi:hypothetical protein